MGELGSGTGPVGGAAGPKGLGGQGGWRSGCQPVGPRKRSRNLRAVLMFNDTL